MRETGVLLNYYCFPYEASNSIILLLFRDPKQASDSSDWTTIITQLRTIHI